MAGRQFHRVLVGKRPTSRGIQAPVARFDHATRLGLRY